MSGTLQTPPNYYKSYPAQIAAKYSNQKLTITSSNSNEITYEGNNVKLFEPIAIAYQVSDSDFRGGKNAVEVIQWCAWSNAFVLPAMATWVYPTLGVIQFNKAQTEKAKQTIKAALARLNNHLQANTFLVGERITLADVSVASDLLLLYQNVLEENAYRKPFPHVVRWFLTVVNQPNVKSVVGDVQLCTKEAQFDNKKYQELHKKEQAAGAKKEKSQPAKKAAAAPQPKKEAPKKDEDEEPAPKKDRDPFANIPKGDKFDMDSWKRAFSNNEYEVAKKYLWDNFDVEHYSFWYCEYLYPEELRLTFMSCNLIGGMFQRLDRMQKNAFGNVCIFGENNNSTISGVWLWRGTGLAFDLSPDLQVDYDCYKWTKLDHTNPEHVKMIDEYFAEKGDFGGKKVCEFKTFK